MADYTLAWWIIAVCAGVGAWALFNFLGTVGLRTMTGRLLICAGLLAVFVTPAPIPREGGLAPALIVMVFEMFFQKQGEPEGSVMALLIGTAAALLIAALIGFGLSRRRT